MIGGRYDIKGYPTVKYFRDGELAFDLNVRDKEKILEFMENPQEPPPPPPPETPWSEEASDVHHLTDQTFKTFLKKKKHVLVMFYAPWCGHCKKAKPEFSAAAEEFSDDPKVCLYIAVVNGNFEQNELYLGVWCTCDYTIHFIIVITLQFQPLCSTKSDEVL